MSQAQRIGANGQPVRYAFHYDPADISRLAIFRDGQWVGDAWAKELRLADGTYRAMSLSERAMVKDLARGHERTAGDWLDYMGELDALRKQRLTEKKTAQRSTRAASPDRTVPANLQTMDQALKALPVAAVPPDPTQLLTSFLDQRWTGRTDPEGVSK